MTFDVCLSSYSKYIVSVASNILLLHVLYPFNNGCLHVHFAFSMKNGYAIKDDYVT